jgi:hypothetical protein
MEVILSALPNPTQVQAAPMSASARATRPQLPPQIANLAQGTRLEGFVINRDSAGNPVLRTPQGDMLIKSELFLKTGSDVVIQLTQQNGQTNARMISVDGKPVQQLLQQQTAAQNATSPASTQTTSPKTLQAVLLAPAQYGATQQTQQTIANILRLPVAQLPPLDKGISLQFKIVSDVKATLPPTLSATPTPSPTTPAASAPNASAHYGAYAKPTATAAPTATPTPPQPASSATSAPTISATVIGHEGPETVLRTPIGSIKLFTTSPLPTGAQLTLEYVPSQNITTAPAPAATTAATVASTSALSHDWEALREALQMLRPDAAAAQPAELASRIPNTKSAMVNNALFFLSALRGNDFQRWLGNASVQKLEEKGGNLLQRLSADFGTIRSIVTADQPDQPWQMLPLPLIHEDALHQARLFWRHEEGDSQDRSDDETRFVFDLTLSALGPLQIDGLVHGQRPHCRCDVVIRTETELDDAMQDELHGLFANASEVAGLSGQLRFSAGKHSMLQPLQELRDAARAPTDKSILA